MATQVDLEENVKQIEEKRRAKPSKRKERENQGYQINQNMAVATLRSYLFNLFTCCEKDLWKLLEEMEKYLSNWTQETRHKRQDKKLSISILYQ
jgi:hypothetical protein